MNKRIHRIFLILTLLLPCSVMVLQAGNPDRAGQAGAVELLINPWARSSGWGGTNIGGVTGVEAMRFNVAGLINIPGTEFMFSRATWLSGSGIYLNSLGYDQKLGQNKTSALGISLMSIDFGKIQVTTTDNPDGTLGDYSPQYFNLGIAYSRDFSHSIKGGVLFRVITEGTTGSKATGIGLDAGIQYFSGVNDRTKFGVSLRNVGTPMTFSGDALALRATIEGDNKSRTLQSRSATFELPSMLNIGFTYDLFRNVDSTKQAAAANKVTLAAKFTSNAFTNDQLGLGLQYGYKNMIFVRAGYVYEKDIYSESRLTSFTGPSAGASLNIPFGKKKEHSFGIDYSYRATVNFGGTHTFGARLSL